MSTNQKYYKKTLFFLKNTQNFLSQWSQKPEYYAYISILETKRNE